MQVLCAVLMQRMLIGNDLLYLCKDGDGLRTADGDQVKWEQTLRATAIAIDGKCNPLNQKREVGKFPPLLELRGRHGGKLLEQLGVLGARVARGREHLVIKAPGLVTLKQARVHHMRRSGSHGVTLSIVVVRGSTERFDRTHNRFRGP